MATQCHIRSGFGFQRKLVVDFLGGEITSDAGLVLLREFDERLGLTAGLQTLWVDERDQRYTKHGGLELLRQRIYQIAAGYEDANDANLLRHDATMQTVAGNGRRALASQPTISRLENDASWESIRLFERQGTEWFCRYAAERHKGRAQEIILDIDSTSDPTHGQQQLTFYNAHYDTYMYHPLLVFEGHTGVLLASCLRPGDVGGIRQLLPLVRPLVRRLRARFPRRRIAIRADGDFAKAPLLDYAEYAQCLYAIGMPRNSKLEAQIAGLRARAETQWKQTNKPVRLFTSFFYKAGSWGHARRIAAKVEYTTLGSNVRFVVTNRSGTAEAVFNWYEQRGQAENFIKELKRDIAADRLSCSAYRANAFRLQLHALTYNLLVLFRRYVLGGTQLALAAIDSVRLRLFKVGARVQRTVRRLWFHIATGWAGQPLFREIIKRLRALRAPT
jgi:DDE family transposase